ncbi:hypothetical protein QBC43DRAFT_337748 [Cladorrhinum sp. PSN259]|nr:hypothetical protein QBC43DRAFT_337748 [Cladorrhinum sp. PSN259]
MPSFHGSKSVHDSGEKEEEAYQVPSFKPAACVVLRERDIKIVRGETQKTSQIIGGERMILDPGLERKETRQKLDCKVVKDQLEGRLRVNNTSAGLTLTGPGQVSESNCLTGPGPVSLDMTFHLSTWETTALRPNDPMAGMEPAAKFHLHVGGSGWQVGATCKQTAGYVLHHAFLGHSKRCVRGESFFVPDAQVGALHTAQRSQITRPPKESRAAADISINSPRAEKKHRRMPWIGCGRGGQESRPDPSSGKETKVIGSG